MTKRIDGMCGYNTVPRVKKAREVVWMAVECAYHAGMDAVPLAVRVTRVARMADRAAYLRIRR